MRAILIIFLSALVHSSACAGSGFGKTDSSRFNIEVQLGNQLYRSVLAASVNNSRNYEYFTITALNAMDHYKGKSLRTIFFFRDFYSLLAPNISIRSVMEIGKAGNGKNPELLIDLTFFEVAYLSSIIQNPYGNQNINVTGKTYNSLGIYYRRSLVRFNELFGQKERKLLIYGGVKLARGNDFHGEYAVDHDVINYYNNPNITSDTIYITRYSRDFAEYSMLLVAGLDWKIPLSKATTGRCMMLSLQYNQGLSVMYGQTVNVQRNSDPNVIQCELETAGSGFIFKIGIDLFRRRFD